MLGNGEAQKDAIRPDFNKSIFIDFAGAKITSDAGFILMRKVNQQFGIIESVLGGSGSISHFLNKGRSIENWQIGTRNSLFGVVAA